MPESPGLGMREWEEQHGRSWAERVTPQRRVQEQRTTMHPWLLCGLSIYPARQELGSQPAWDTPRQPPAQQAGAGRRNHGPALCGGGAGAAVRVLPRGCLHRKPQAHRSGSSTLQNCPRLNQRGGLGHQNSSLAWCCSLGVCVCIMPSQPPVPPAPAALCTPHGAGGLTLPKHWHGGHKGTLMMPSRMFTFRHSCHAGINEQLLITGGHALSHTDVSWKQPGQRQSLLSWEVPSLWDPLPGTPPHHTLETSL